jgi:hypothetical protein
MHLAPGCAHGEHSSRQEFVARAATEVRATAGRKGHVIAIMKKVVSAGMVVVLTAGAVTVARWLGMRPDGRVEQLLASPSALERWTSQRECQQAEKAHDSKPPLIAQAEAFAAYLNPPAPPKQAVPTPAPARPRPSYTEPKPVVAAPPLRLLGISYHCSNPAESRALVWESVGGHRWVRQGTQLGHIVIEQINPGSILCRDDGGTREVVMESEAVPVMPTRSTPAPSPTGGSAGRTAIAKSATSQNGTENAQPVKAGSIETSAPETIATQVEAPKKETQESRSSPSKRSRPVRSVAKKG